MYTHILVPVEHSDADQTILSHVGDLAHMTSARLLLVHVADGWAARNYDQLALRESEEMQDDRAYLEKLADEVRNKGLTVDCKLAMGDPAS
jgi:nucleotide-binding universal stress UspA family protein